MTKRSFFIGLVLVILQTAIAPYNNYFIQNTKIGGNHFPVGAIFVLSILIIVVNVIIRKVKPGTELKPAELITIWLMMAASSGMGGMGLMECLPATLVTPIYFATPENEWEDVLYRHIPEWIMVWDEKACTYFYEGIPGGMPIPWGVWIKPMLVWTLFACIIFFGMVCLSVILREQWIDRERFTFPLIQVPIEMVEQPEGRNLFNSFFKNRVMLFGLAVPFVYHMVNGLHSYMPVIPQFPSVFNLYEPFTEKPWITLRWWPALRFFIFFSVIGITYLLTLEVSFSLWFFFLMFKAQYIVMNAMGLRIDPWTSASRQVMGGSFIFTIFVFWVGREHIGAVVRKTFSKQGGPDDSNEPMPYRWAFTGFIASLILVVVGCYVAGISLWVGATISMSILITSVVLTWMVANGGLLLVQAPYFPSEYAQVIFGSAVIGARSTAVMGFERTFLRDWGEFLMPHVMHAFKVTDLTRINRRKLLEAITVAVAIAIVISWYATLSVAYHKGGFHMSPGPYVNRARNYFTQMALSIQNRQGTNWPHVSSMIAGAVVTTFLLFMRHRFIWWPLHPIGYLLGSTYPPFFLWGTIFIGWLAKYIILKYGGIRTQRKMRPFFLGLILGEYITVGFWMILAVITGTRYTGGLPGL